MADFDIATEYTLPGVLRQKAPDGSFMPAIDVLSGKYPLLEEGYWMEANDDTTHEFVRATSEPSGSLVRYNEGTAFEAAGSIPVKEYLTRMESMLRIDVRVLEKSSNPVAYRREKEAAHVRGMIKQFNKICFGIREGSGTYTYFGDMSKDPKSINGLEVRYNALTTAASPVDNVRQMAVPGATANVQSSILLVKHGPQGLFFLHPKTAGRTFQIVDLKEQLIVENSKACRYVVTQFAFEFGIGVGDERCIQRLANIATAQAIGSFDKDTTSVTQGEEALIDMIERLPGGEIDNCAFYCGPALMAAFRKRLNSKANLYFNVETVWGRDQLTFMGIPVVRNDVLFANEAIIS